MKNKFGFLCKSYGGWLEMKAYNRAYPEDFDRENWLHGMLIRNQLQYAIESLKNNIRYEWEKRTINKLFNTS